ncbi:MAG: hypothetical protein GY749_08290 [Desulfobacteraceae bacterium]|nr:hypothetical protein [Desulfobacteraceae bacterium]
MNIATKSLNDIIKEAVTVLNNTIGLANTLRFINQFSTGYGDYTEERKKMFENMGLDDIVAEIKQMRRTEKADTQ